ncbi:hypothetical protein B296_00039649 [Ensete ventricosum]|uniref:Uncharacterized protein n=1 Tax=Ensete ventricosum TaxID=4639 RepID=A0A426XQE5_ENSVE|nr:hypothetical protein B296_00039649 [Ensete ventricosum]
MLGRDSDGGEGGHVAASFRNPIRLKDGLGTANSCRRADPSPLLTENYSHPTTTVQLRKAAPPVLPPSSTCPLSSPRPVVEFAIGFGYSADAETRFRWWRCVACMRGNQLHGRPGGKEVHAHCCGYEKKEKLIQSHYPSKEKRLLDEVAGMRTARYRAVPPKIDRRRSISAIGGRLREKSTVDG